MARPLPLILHTHTEPKVGKRTEVLAATDVWFVTYGGTPIGLRTDNAYKDVQRKYGRTTFVNSGMAFNAAESLNRKFNTDLFDVRRLTAAEIAKERSSTESDLES